MLTAGPKWKTYPENGLDHILNRRFPSSTILPCLGREDCNDFQLRDLEFPRGQGFPNVLDYDSERFVPDVSADVRSRLHRRRITSDNSGGTLLLTTWSRVTLVTHPPTRKVDDRERLKAFSLFVLAADVDGPHGNEFRFSGHNLVDGNWQMIE